MAQVSWPLVPGEVIRRVDLHVAVGGARQGGIGPSAGTPNVLVFSDPTTGALYGYYDRWEGPVFHYTGEGQVGDQAMTHGNKAIRDHAADGRALRIFKGVRGRIRYEGEFALERDQPWYNGQAPDREGTMRKVIVFRMRPVDGGVPVTVNVPTAAGASQVTRGFGAEYERADESATAAARVPFAVDPDAVDRGTRGHARTQNGLAAMLASNNIRPLRPGKGDPDFDLAWRKGGAWFVAEVKSLTEANESRQLRLALGQVLDYHDQLARRHADVRAVIAVERAPRDPRWVALCERHGVILVWPSVFETVLSTVLSA